jgi:hypothetical protein
LRPTQPHPERRTGQVEQRQAGQRDQVSGEHLGGDVGAGPQWRDPQCRIHPPDLSRATRDPGETAANIAPYTAIAVMKYSGKLMRSKVACRWPEATP